MRLGILSDVHYHPQPPATDRYHNVYATDRDALLAAGLQHCLAAGVHALVILGDLVDDGDPALLAWVAGQLAASQTPAWVVPGNHDCVQQDDALARVVRAAGAGHLRLAGAAGVQLDEGIRLAGLGLLRHTGPQAPEAIEVPDPEPWGSDLVLYLSHYPVLSTRDQILAAGFKHPGDLTNHAAVARPLLSRTAPTIALHGHLHVRDEVANGTVLQLGSAAMVEPPHEATVLDITRSQDAVHVQRRSAALKPTDAEQLPVLTPGETAWVWEQAAWRRA